MPEEFRKEMMRKVDRDAFYSGEEIKEILRGHVSLDALRKHGLIGLASGFWGGNVIEAVDSYIRDKGHLLGDEDRPTRTASRSPRGKHVKLINFQDVIDMRGPGGEHAEGGMPCSSLPPGKSRPRKGVR